MVFFSSLTWPPSRSSHQPRNQSTEYALRSWSEATVVGTAGLSIPAPKKKHPVDLVAKFHVVSKKSEKIKDWKMFSTFLTIIFICLDYFRCLFVVQKSEKRSLCKGSDAQILLKLSGASGASPFNTQQTNLFSNHLLSSHKISMCLIDKITKIIKS